MNKSKRSRTYKIALINFLRVFIFLVMSCIAIMAGVTGGNFISGDGAASIQKINVDVLKKTMDRSIPMIDTVYNNGNVRPSLLGTFENLISGLFGFDLNEPVTVLNTQSLLMYSYYKNDYQQYLAELNKRSSQTASNTEPGKDDPLKTDASSITYVENEDGTNSEKKDNKLVTKDSISVMNETKYKIDIEELLNEPLKIKVDKKGPQILIYHTHTTESFIKSLDDLKKNTDTRNKDPRYNVVRVGDELAQTLKKKYNFGVLHNGTIHDVPDFNIAYSKSLITVKNYMKSYPTIGMTFDIHRDAGGSGLGKLRAVTKVGSKYVAQVMFVVGTGQDGIQNPNWKENFKFALKLQERLNEICPGIVKPIDLSFNRYNSHVTNGSLIIEIGADGNLLSECIESTKYVAQAINDVINGK